MTRDQVGWYKTSDDYTDGLFRKAVLAIRGNRCEVCGQMYPLGQLHVHHLVKRGYDLLRWDVRNGAVICEKCHLNNVHGDGWDQFMLDSSPYCEFLTDAKQVNFADWLVKQGKTREEFHIERRDVLKEIVKTLTGTHMNVLGRAS